MGIRDLFFQAENEQNDEIAELKRLSGIETEEKTDDMYSASIMEEPVIEVDVSEFENDGVVPILEIYGKEGIADLSRSIFKVEEIRSVVPAEIATDARKKTVLGMLKVSGLDVEALVNDADTRVATLAGAKEAFSKAAEDSILESESQIAELERKIDELKQGINKTKITNEAQTVSIDSEINRISDIVSFIKV